MTAHLLVLAGVVLMGIGLYLEIRYAKANYPASIRWRTALFVTTFAGTALFALVIVSDGGLDRMQSVLFVLIMALASGTLFAFAFPRNMQNVFPKRKPPNSHK